MVEPHVEQLADSIHGHGSQHHARGVGEDGVDGRRHPVRLAGRVEKPRLAKAQEEDGDEKAQENSLICGLLAFALAQDVGDEERYGKKHVAQRLLDAEGAHHHEGLDVGENHGQARDAVQAGFAEESVGEERHAENEDDRSNEKKLVHTYIRLSGKATQGLVVCRMGDACLMRRRRSRCCSRARRPSGWPQARDRTLA